MPEGHERQVGWPFSALPGFHATTTGITGFLEMQAGLLPGFELDVTI